MLHIRGVKAFALTPPFYNHGTTQAVSRACGGEKREGEADA